MKGNETIARSSPHPHPPAEIGLYVHVPFCRNKCNYCSFYSLPQAPQGLQEVYVRALQQELAASAAYPIATVYLGGGTPTCLKRRLLLVLLHLIAELAPSPTVEWTCEANPEDLDEECIDLLRSSGVNRVSLGVQTFNPELLAVLGRRHTASRSIQAVQQLRRSGFTNINIDLIYGIPGSSLHTLQQDLDLLLELRPEHVSAYLLTVEDGTLLKRLQHEGKLSLPEEDTLAEQYELIRRVLVGAGYEHYEISNFALPGYRCRHNWRYWSAAEYLGCGPAAHSFLAGRRWANPADLEEWAQGILSGSPRRELDEDLSPERRARELLVLGLRRTEGVERNWFRAVTGWELEELCQPEIENLVDQGLLIFEGNRLRLAPDAYFVSDAVFRELI